MARIGVLTFSDGRDFMHRRVAEFCRGVEAEIANTLTTAGHEVVRAREILGVPTFLHDSCPSYPGPFDAVFQHQP